MTVGMPAYSFYNSGYKVAIKLKNVSDKPIYDLEHKITDLIISLIRILCSLLHQQCLQETA